MLKDVCARVYKEALRLYRGVINHPNVWQHNYVDTEILCSAQKTCQPLLLKYGLWTILCLYLELVLMQFLGQEV